MENFGKLLLLVLAACIASLFLRGSPFRSLAALAALAPALMLLVGLLRPVGEFALRLSELSGVEPAVFQPVWKAAAIGLLTQMAGSFCADAGEQALQKLLELGGIVTMLYVSLPLYEAVLSMLQRLMEG